MNELPYDNNWIFGASGAKNLTILRGNWRWGGSQVYVVNDLTIGDITNPEHIDGYNTAEMTFDWDGSSYSNGLPPYMYTAQMSVGGATYLGKTAGSNGYLTLIGCGTNPTFVANDVFVGGYGNGKLNLQNSSVQYNNLYIGAGQDSTGAVDVNGTPVPGYRNSLESQYVGPNSPIAQVVIGDAGTGSLTMRNGATTTGARFLDLYTGRLQASMGAVTLGQLAGSAGTFSLTQKSSAYAFSMNVGLGGQGTLTLDDSSLYIAQPYTPRVFPNVGNLTAQGQGEAMSDVRLTDGSRLTAQSGININANATMEIYQGSSATTWNFSEDGGTTTIANFGSRLNTLYGLVGAPGGSNFSSLTVEDGATVNVQGGLRTGDNGLVSVFGDGTITVGQAQGPTTPGHIQLGFGGALGGRGIFQATVDNTGGTIDPGFSPGQMTILGDLNMSDGSIYLQLGGTDPGTGYDVLNVTGALNITGGTIIFDTYNGFVPTPGEQFDFFHAGFLNIGPGVVIENDLGVNFDFNPATGHGTAAAVPEPMSFLALGLGTFGFLIRTRRKSPTRVTSLE